VSLAAFDSRSKPAQQAFLGYPLVRLVNAFDFDTEKGGTRLLLERETLTADQFPAIRAGARSRQ